jgi:hypothetical protein
LQIFVSLQLNNTQSAVSIDGKQIEHASISGRKRWHLRVDRLAAQAREEFYNTCPELRVKPPFRLHPEERIIVRSVSMPAGKEPGTKLAAETLSFRPKRRFVRSRPECDLFLLRERMSRRPVTHARKFESM